MATQTLSILGCGNLGSAILQSIVDAIRKDKNALPFNHFVATVRSDASLKRRQEQFSSFGDSVEVWQGRNVEAATAASKVVILAVDPADVAATLRQDGLLEALYGKLLISVAAGWGQDRLEATLWVGRKKETDEKKRIWILRTLPNIAALVSQSLTAIETPPASNPPFPKELLETADAIFATCGRAVHVPTRLMNAATAVAGSTPAFFAVLVDALVDAAVAVGMPRDDAQTMIYQSMAGSAAMLQRGGANQSSLRPEQLRDMGTSPEGCTIAGIMELEERGVRGAVGRAMREAVTVARLMETTPHVNDTRRG